MGVFRVPLEIGNPANQRTEIVEALVDTGATFSMVPASILRELGLEPSRTVTFRIASGESVEYPTAWASFSAGGRSGMARVIFGPEDQYLLGATTLEDLLLVPDPIGERLVPTEALLLSFHVNQPM